MANLLLKYMAFFYKAFINFTPEKNDRANTQEVLHSGYISQIYSLVMFIIPYVRCFTFLDLGFSLCCTKLDIYTPTS